MGGAGATTTRAPSEPTIKFTQQVRFLKKGLPMWSIRLSDPQREALRSLLIAQGELGPSLSASLECLELARWDDLPEAELPWESVSALAAMQGIGEADVVWDLASGLRTPLGPVARGGARAK